MASSSRSDWLQDDDLDGRGKYRTLQISYYATLDDIKKAYRDLARKYHPDKGGDAASFARIQDAFETLSVKSKRAVYDEWAKLYQFRRNPLRAHAAQGGEEEMFKEMSSSGVVCDPLTQLIVLCEVCGRPSTKECWTCKMPICSFCTLKRHWREGVPLHWPLINSAHMQTRLAKRELEKKRLEDAKLLDMEDPHWRSELQLKDMRSFRIAALKMQANPERMVTYSYDLAKLYVWAQTDSFVHLALHCPTGYSDREISMDCDGHVLRVSVADSPPILERALDAAIDMAQPVESFKTKNNRTLVMSLAKQEAGKEWDRLFRGDSMKIRCMQQPYRIQETDRDVSIEADLPAFVDPSDVKVEIGESQLVVELPGLLKICRTYWQPKEETKRAGFEAVDAVESMWSLEEGRTASGGRCKTLFIHLVKPEANEDEVTWKKGKRADNTTAERNDASRNKGFRFFQDDEDEYSLEDILQAVSFLETGCTWVPKKPWEPWAEDRLVKDVKDLSKMAQRHLEMLLDEHERHS